MDQSENEHLQAPAPEPVTLPASTDSPSRSGSFQKPSDYYSTPPQPAGKSGCPKWVPLGCGLGGCLVVILMFAASTLVMSNGGGKVLDFVFSQIKEELPQLISPNVSPQQRLELERQIDVLLQKVDRKEVNLVSVQPILQKLQRAIGDGEITPDEAGEIITVLRKVNSGDSRTTKSPEKTIPTP